MTYLDIQKEFEIGDQVQINELFSIKLAQEPLENNQKMVMISTHEGALKNMIAMESLYNEDEATKFRNAKVWIRLEELSELLNDMANYIDSFKAVIISGMLDRYRELFERALFPVKEVPLETLEKIRTKYPEKTDAELEIYKFKAERTFAKQKIDEGDRAHTIAKLNNY